VLVQATHEGTSGFTSVRVVLSADTDGDGLPDDLELSLGLNPNDPADALEDFDKDGASNRDEGLAGTNIRDADSDDDGLNDGEELRPGADGFLTNPLSADTDGDGVRDGLEVATGSDPTSAGSVNLAQALKALTVTPPTFSITVNSVIGVGSQQLTVTGHLTDGTSLNLTSTLRGTNYASSDLNGGCSVRRTARARSRLPTAGSRRRPTARSRTSRRRRSGRWPFRATRTTWTPMAGLPTSPPARRGS
jgi:hypothetical protein